MLTCLPVSAKPRLHPLRINAAIQAIPCIANAGPVPKPSNDSKYGFATALRKESCEVWMMIGYLPKLIVAPFRSKRSDRRHWMGANELAGNGGVENLCNEGRHVGEQNHLPHRIHSARMGA